MNWEVGRSLSGVKRPTAADVADAADDARRGRGRDGEGFAGLAVPGAGAGAGFARLNAFLLDHAFYPLLFCTLVSFAFLATRAYIRKDLGYRFLVWNLFLAWVPYYLSLVAAWMHDVKPALRPAAKPPAKWLVAAVWASWLAMFPNAPYIFTDLVHWRARREMPWWFDLGLVLMFALAGCFLGIVSLRIMHDLVRRSIGRFVGWVFVFAVAILSGFGVYLGRFERWNSWDLLTHPHHIFAQILRGMMHPFEHGRTLGVTMMFGAMMLATYVMFVSTSPRRDVRVG